MKSLLFFTFYFLYSVHPSFLPCVLINSNSFLMNSLLLYFTFTDSYVCLMSILRTLITDLLHVFRPSFLAYVTPMLCSKCFTSHHILSFSYCTHSVFMLFMYLSIFLHYVILFLLYISLISSYTCLMPAGD